MSNASKKELSQEASEKLISILKNRFEKNPNRHKTLLWSKIESKLKKNPSKLFSLSQMEETGGEPDVVEYDSKTDEYLFFDCSLETPKNRRSFCYDLDAQNSRKEFKPKNNALSMAASMNCEILSETQYRYLQNLGEFDLKTSSWIKTPQEIRKLGGALFADRRYNTVFIYHNGAESYYASRGFRCVLKV